jgi:hypothetical protein
LDKKASEILQPQDGVALLDSLGKLKNVPKAITDAAAIGHTIVYGQGLKGKLSVNQLFNIVNSR